MFRTDTNSQILRHCEIFGCFNNYCRIQSVLRLYTNVMVAEHSFLCFLGNYFRNV